MSEKGKVLAVDDARVMRMVVSRKLEETGFEVITADCGNEALEKIDAESFDLVVLDNHMPDLTGLEVLEKIRERFSAIQLPVIMATADDDEEDIVRAFEKGANDFVSKPINFPVLFARIETHLRLKRASEELERLAGSGGD